MHKRLSGLRRSTASTGFSAVIGLLATTVIAGPAAALDRVWLLGEDGLFSEPVNWDPLGVPGPLDTAVFTITETFAVEFTTPVVNQLLDVAEGEVTFDLGGFGYDAKGLVVGNGSDEVGVLEVLGGTITITPAAIPLFVRIGKDAGSDGTLEIAGTGAMLNTSDTLILGDGGVGSMRASTGGIIQSGLAILGDDAGATGSATVVGINSSWTCGDVLDIGNFGAGSLAVRIGGTVITSGGFAADDPGSSATVTVEDAGSTWTNNGAMNFGNAGVADLDVLSGGVVTWSGISRLGDDLGASGSVVIDGLGSTLSVGSELFVGNLGHGSIAVSNGGALETTRVKVGDETGSLGAVTLASGSTWSDTVDIFVGNFGVGTLDVTGGSSVTGVTGTLGDDPDSSGTVVIDGVGSAWNSSSTLRIGDLGSGTLTVSGGASVSASSVTIAVQAGSVGLLRVVDGGQVDAQSGYVQNQNGDLEIVLGPDSANMITLTGTANLGGTLDVSLSNGYSLEGGSSVTIIQGGTVSGAFASITTAPGLEVTVEATRVIVTAAGEACPADIDGSGDVGFGDILEILGNWGPCGECPADIDNDGIVGFSDILAVLGTWGPCP